MELRQLRYFVAVAEELHFGRAADKLSVVQPAVSQQVARLERELGVQLLARTSRRVALTGDGVRVLAEARATLAAAERLRAVATDLSAGRAATLRLGTSPGMGERLHRGIAALRTLAPDMGLVLVDGTPAAHSAALRAGELDIALVRGAVRAQGLRSVELWRDPLTAVLPAAHPAAAEPALPITALAGLLLRLPVRAEDPALHDGVLAACRLAGFAPCTGRPVRSVQDALIEVGASEHDVVFVYGEPAAPPSVALRPVDPPLDVPGSLLVREDGPHGCVEALSAAFG